MNLCTLTRRNRWHHRRANFALLLGVAVGTAVLTGALMVGDSLRGSLREQVEKQLKGVVWAMTPGRFFQNPMIPDAQAITYVPVTVSSSMRTASNVTLHTVIAWNSPNKTTDYFKPQNWHSLWSQLRSSFGNRNFVSNWVYSHTTWYLPIRQTVAHSGALDCSEAYITQALAKALAVSTGDSITVRFPKRSVIARDSILGHKTSDSLSTRLDYKVVVDDTSDEYAAFRLSPGFDASRCILVDPGDLEMRLGQRDIASAVISQYEQSPQVTLRIDNYDLGLHAPLKNTLTIAESIDRDKSNSLDPREYRRRLADSMIQAADANNDKTLSRDELIAYFRKKGYFSLESKSLLLSKPAEEAALAVAKELGLIAESTLVYLANTIADGTTDVPYSLIAAVDPQSLLPAGAPPLADDEIILVDCPETPWQAKPGDRITIKYFLPESEGKATETSAEFNLRARIPMQGRAADPHITPEFPGITDKLTLGEWDPPFPYDPKRITKRDEDYWDKYRTTPKAYVNQSVGRKLFGSRFGNATSVRIWVPDDADIERVAGQFHDALLKKLKPEDFGFVFENVRERALAASQGGTDFGGLFIGFSFYLIAAALLLIVLLVRLGLDRRASEVGLLLACGYPLTIVRRLLMREGLWIAAWGALLGLVLAIGFSWLMLKLLAAMWPEGSIGSFLNLHVEPGTLLIGFVLSMLMAAATIWWGLRTLKKASSVQLLRGVAIQVEPTKNPTDLSSSWFLRDFVSSWFNKSQPRRHEDAKVSQRSYYLFPIALCFLALALLISGSNISGHEARAGAFFGAGALLLVAGLSAFRGRLRNQDTPSTSDQPSLARLGVRNAGRNPSRSMLTTGLLASAAFLLVAVESFRRSPEKDFHEPTGGSGGYELIANFDLPLYQDPNDADTGRKEVLDALERAYQTDPATKAAKLADAQKLLAETEFVMLRQRPGDDAGCRNLYRPTKPRLVGLPKKFIERGGFHFSKTQPQPTANTWEFLNTANPTNEVPVFAEGNTATWMLHKSLGDNLPFKDSTGAERPLQFAGLLQDSIFQGELLMSEANFLAMFPETQGYGALLIDAPVGRTDEVRRILEIAFTDRGIEVAPTIDRLKSYLAVENTYLATFQILGGFGLLLGVIGLAIVVLRSVWERRGEMALLRAVGFSPNDLQRIILSENMLLLIVGLGIGIAAAFIAILPQLISGEAGLPIARTLGFVLVAIVVGVLVGAFAIRSNCRAPIVTALRTE